MFHIPVRYGQYNDLYDKLRQVLKVHFQGRKTLQIAEITRLSRNTVRKYLTTLEKLALNWEQGQQLSDKDLHERFCGEPIQSPDERLLVLHRFLEANNKRLGRRGYTVSARPSASVRV